MKVFITCEHGGNKIPKEFRYLFKDERDILQTHRAFDPGALELAKAISKRGYYFTFSEISRLFVELNRSIHNPALFSGFTKNLSPGKKEEILVDYYFPFRNKVETSIRELISKKIKVIHISVHTFTPILNNKIRNTDIGILYDPKRKREKNFAVLFKNKLKSFNKKIKTRFNYPYLGIADGFTSYLRKKFPREFYIGIELEVNQKLFLNHKHEWRELKQDLNFTLDSILREKVKF